MNKETLSKKRRGYSSQLREQQSEQTRELILASVAKLLRAGELDDLSFSAVAAKSGASVATIYRYFPSRKALFQGLDDWLGRELKRPPTPRNFQELVEATGGIFSYYEQNKDLFATFKIAAVIREMNKEGQEKRDRSFGRVLAPLTRHLDDRKANAIHALFRQFYGSEGFLSMNGRFGVTAAEASEAAVWAAKTLAAALEKEQAKAKGEKK